MVDRVLSLLARLLPYAAEVPARRRRAAAAALAVLLISLGANLASAAFAAGSPLMEAIFNRWAQQVVMGAVVALCALRVRRNDPDRAAWLALTVALGCWTIGNTYWNVVLYSVEEPPFPSPADAGWLLFYPFAYLCLGLHARRTTRGIAPSMWLDGLVGLFAVGAVGIVVLIAPLTAGRHVGTAELIFGSANGILDLLLLSLVITLVGLGGGGRGRAWLLLGAGFAVWTRPTSRCCTSTPRAPTRRAACSTRRSWSARRSWRSRRGSRRPLPPHDRGRAGAPSPSRSPPGRRRSRCCSRRACRPISPSPCGWPPRR